MPRVLLILAAIAALAGCATPTPTPVAGSGSAGVSGFATIAQWGKWEWELAPASTRAQVALHNARMAYTRGRIDLPTLMQADAIVDQVVMLLARSRRGDAEHPTQAQRDDFSEALRLLDRLDDLLKGLKR